MNAAREYQTAQTACRVALARITAALDAHAARQAMEVGYWTFVGDLKHARIELLRIAAALGDEESREVLHSEGVDR